MPFPTLVSTRIDEESPASADVFTDLAARDLGNSEKPIELEFPLTASAAPVGAPTVLLNGVARLIPQDGNRLTFRADVKNSDGATNGVLRCAVASIGNVDIPINNGDVALTAKTADLVVTPGFYAFTVTLWRTGGAGTVSAQALGIISTTWNVGP